MAYLAGPMTLEITKVNWDDTPPSPKSPDPVSYVPTTPFPFLQLPREIRDLIYYHALSGPEIVVFPDPLSQVDSRLRSSEDLQKFCWGTENSTRLFRVNHQVSSEASQLFYSTFHFRFSYSFSVQSVNALFRDCLSVKTRNLISNICFPIVIWRTPGSFPLKDEEKRRQAIAAAIRFLPNLRRVALTVSLNGDDVSEGKVKGVVDRALKVASPLKNMPGLYIFGGVNETSQQAYIMEEMRRDLGCL